VVQVLLAKDNIELDSKDKDKQTPLSWASQVGWSAVIEMLLATGQVDPDAKDTNGRTALSWVAGRSHTDKRVVELPSHKAMCTQIQTTIWVKPHVQWPQKMEII
jgi:ankyrin repeat protein